jgi:hypothetical protein
LTLASAIVWKHVTIRFPFSLLLWYQEHAHGEHLFPIPLPSWRCPSQA